GTDFILSAEIIVLSLGVISDAPFAQQAMALVAIALGITAFVYGLVAGIVKLDDFGLWLCQKAGRVQSMVGGWILAAAPWLMKGLTVLGTAAMFLVGGGIFVHGIPWLHGVVVDLSPGGAGGFVVEMLGNAVVGLVVGVVVLAAVEGFNRVRNKTGQPDVSGT